jgi:hypothetical protein
LFNGTPVACLTIIREYQLMILNYSDGNVAVVPVFFVTVTCESRTQNS